MNSQCRNHPPTASNPDRGMNRFLTDMEPKLVSRGDTIGSDIIGRLTFNVSRYTLLP